VQSAQAQVDLRQAELDALLAPETGRVASSQANVALATAQYEAAVARHESLLAGAADADIAAAEADLASAQATLDDLLSGPSAADLKIAETRVAQAETGLLEAQNDLAEASLKAPFAGIVTTIHVAEGELSSGVAVELFDSQSLEVVLGVDEIDVGQLALGQPATVTLETWPNDEISSEVTAIAPSPTADNSGLVTYNVHLTLDDTDLPVLAGMTANADLITDVGKDVLLVPNAAVTADREKGTHSVNLVRTAADGTVTVESVEVTIGLQDRENTQIVSGLQEGDVVLLGTFAAPVRTFGGPPGNGDNNRGPGF
jgi:HlyD family secretion protein